MPDVPDTDGQDAGLFGLTVTANARVIKAAQPADDADGDGTDG